MRLRLNPINSDRRPCMVLSKIAHLAAIQGLECNQG